MKPFSIRPARKRCYAFVASYTNLTIRNGSIRDWDQNGMNDRFTAYHVHCDRLQVLNNKGAGLDFGYGIHASGSRVINCSCQFNLGEGIDGFNGSLVSGCLCSYNARSGIAIGTDSVAINNDCLFNNTSNVSIEGGLMGFIGPGRMEGNHVSYSIGTGILVRSGAAGFVVIKNTTAGNTYNAFSIPAGNDAGPWGKAATSTSPWANIYN